MEIVFVHVHVKQPFVNKFISASLENARNSINEPGITRFDVVQQTEDMTRFILVEVYKSKDAQIAHKDTPHYKKWRDTVADMMEGSRTGIKYKNIYPSDEGW